MIEIYYRILKHGPDGNLVKDTGLVPSGSYVIQFLELIKGLFDGILLVTATNVGGGETRIIKGDQNLVWFCRVRAPALNDTYGIVVGTNAGTTAEDNENFKLDTKILHDGAGAAGKMNYRDVIINAPAVDGANVDFDMTRAFINETGVTITVKEIGIIVYSAAELTSHLILRDVVADEDVLDGYTLTVIYTLRTTA